MKKRIFYLVTAIFIVIVIVFMWQYVLQPSITSKDKEKSILVLPFTTDTENNEKSIVVLPFKTDSTDNEDEYFANGLMADIISNLATVSDLRIISRISAEKYRDSNLSIIEIGKELGVNYVLEGRIHKQEDKLRIDVQLIETKNMAHIYDDRFLRDTSNLSDITSEISREIIRKIQ